MKKVFILLIALMGICAMGAAQNSDAKVQRNGNVFSSVKQNKAKVEPMATTFQWEDAKGVQYPIWVNPNSGRCFVIKTSKNVQTNDIIVNICSNTSVSANAKAHIA